MKTKKKKKKKENMTLDDSLLILPIYNYPFYENDTNEVKGSYHDDCLEKKKQQQKTATTYFAY